MKSYIGTTAHTQHCHILAFLEVLSQELLLNTWAEHRDAEWAHKQTLNKAGGTGTQCYDSQFQNKMLLIQKPL